MKVKVHGIWSCPKCRLFQYWLARNPQSNRFDRLCAKCGHRVRAVIERAPGNRGRPREFFLERRPGYEPRSAIRQELRRRNARVMKIIKAESRYEQLKLGEFVQASDLVSEDAHIREYASRMTDTVAAELEDE